MLAWIIYVYQHYHLIRISHPCIGYVDFRCSLDWLSAWLCNVCKEFGLFAIIGNNSLVEGFFKSLAERMDRNHSHEVFIFINEFNFSIAIYRSVVLFSNIRSTNIHKLYIPHNLKCCGVTSTVDEIGYDWL